MFIKNVKRGLNLDRRAARSDRRTDTDRRSNNSDPNYKGPTSRYTIDRRLNLKDRRDKE
jgi:hypothetical protein